MVALRGVWGDFSVFMRLGFERVGMLCVLCRLFVTLPVLLMLAVLATVIAVVNS